MKLPRAATSSDDRKDCGCVIDDQTPQYRKRSDDQA